MEFAYKGKPVSCKRLGYKLWAVMKKAIIPKIKVNDEILIRQHGSNTAKNICIYE